MFLSQSCDLIMCLTCLPVSPLNRELREYPEWLLLMVGVSVLILGKAGSLSVLWFDAAVSLTDQEIPEDVQDNNVHPAANRGSAFCPGANHNDSNDVLLPTGSPLQLTLSTSSSSSSSSTSRRMLFTACFDSFNWQKQTSTPEPHTGYWPTWSDSTKQRTECTHCWQQKQKLYIIKFIETVGRL